MATSSSSPEWIDSALHVHLLVLHTGCCIACHSEFSGSVFFLFLYVFNIFSVIVLSVCLSVLFYRPRCLKLKLMIMMTNTRMVIM